MILADVNARVEFSVAFGAVEVYIPTRKAGVMAAAANSREANHPLPQVVPTARG
jgi:hypothetical protein